MTLRRAIPLIVVALGSASCGDDGGDTVLVLAAASLGDSFAEMEAAFEERHPDIDVEVSPAGSSALRLQIEQGAPADVVAVANDEVMIQLAGEGHVEEFATFATNDLVVAASPDAARTVEGATDLADTSLLVGLCAPQVPCGGYALDALAAADITADPDTEEPDVRSLSAKLASGELDVGVVYATDATTDGLEVVEVLSGADVTYPIATLVDAPHAEAAQRFVDFVLSADGAAILSDAGFGAP